MLAVSLTKTPNRNSSYGPGATSLGRLVHSRFVLLAEVGRKVVCVASAAARAH